MMGRDLCRRARLCMAAVICALPLASGCYGQQASESNGGSSASGPATATGSPVERAPEKTKETPDHRILGVLPNYRTANPMDVYEPISTKQKFTIAAKDSFDWPNFLVSGTFAGLYQLENQNPAFGQGMKGYAHRYWTAFIDQSMGNVMAEAVFPTLLHEDPRYFRKVSGSKLGRTRYALTRVLVTRTDAGGTRFNFSEILGNGVMASIGNAYYPANRGFGDTMQRMGMQVATDAFSNMLKEFWPDVKQRFFHKKPVE